MIAVWCAICALCTAWVACDSVLSFVVAPRLFEIARAEGPGDAFAGLVFGEILGRWVVIAGLACVIPTVCLLAAAAGRALKRSGAAASALPLVCSLILLSCHVASTTVVSRGLDRAAELREHPDAEKMAEFKGRFHARSRLVFGLEMLAALGTAVGAAVAASRCARPPVPHPAPRPVSA